jgi:hypothetical protein
MGIIIPEFIDKSPLFTTHKFSLLMGRLC